MTDNVRANPSSPVRHQGIKQELAQAQGSQQNAPPCMEFDLEPGEVVFKEGEAQASHMLLPECEGEHNENPQ